MNTEYWFEFSPLSGAGDGVEAFLKKKILPGVILGGLLLQGGNLGQYEKEFLKHPLGELVQEEQKGKEDHSLPEPQELPGNLVTVGLQNAVSGDTAGTIIVRPAVQTWHYGYKVLQENEPTNPPEQTIASSK